MSIPINDTTDVDEGHKAKVMMQYTEYVIAAQENQNQSIRFKC
jgi:hypothetical protein